jgi:outer membrane protein assembly factor BamB
MMKNTDKLTQAAVGVMFLMGMGSVQAQDWPQWRGPNRDGKVRGYSAPQSWPKELTQKWKATVGLGDATPALVGERLYAFGRQDANEVILCLDAASGKMLWQDSYPAGFAPTGPSAGHIGPRGSPAVADGKLCTFGVGGVLSCLDASTGKVLWRKQSASGFLDTAYQFESSMSPIIVDGLCIAYVGGKGQGAMIAFDLASGQAKWKCTGDAPAPSSPAILTIEGDRQVVTLSETQAIGVSLADGTLLWQVPFKSRPVNSTTPVIDGQTVIVTGQGMGTMAIKVAKASDKYTAETLWTNDDAQAGATFTTPVLRDGLLFSYTNARLVCLSAEDGHILWADTVSRGRSAAIVDAGSCLIALTLNGELSVYQPTDKAYAEMAHFKVTDTEAWAHPVVSGEGIFVRDKDSIALWTIQ